MSDRGFTPKDAKHVSAKLRETLRLMRERSKKRRLADDGERSGQRERDVVVPEWAMEKESDDDDDEKRAESESESDSEGYAGDDVFRIKQEIKLRKNMLLAKKTNLSDRSKMNDLLRSVKKDYSKYHRKMRDDKKQLHAALSLLKQYMDDLVTTEKLVGKQFDVAKEDQSDVLRSINKIKRELDDLGDDDDESDDD